MSSDALPARPAAEKSSHTGPHQELPQDVALQIHRILSSNKAARSGPADDEDQDEGLSSWTSTQPLSSQVDALLLRSSAPSSSSSSSTSPQQPLTLPTIDKIQAQLRRDLRECEARIEVMTAELSRDTDPERMSMVQNSIADLLSQLHTIREKARESENVVKEITRDIRSLDIAKKNVVASMTALKRLQMLVNGVDQLERLAETKRYREAASALQAVRSLLDFFSSYRGVERISLAWKQVSDLQTQLRSNVMKDYEQFFLHDAGARTIRNTTLPESALVIDAIGPEARNSLIDWYCSLQLREYRRIFRATDEAGQLDNVSRRFAWFRRILKVYEDEHKSAFLKEWRVDRWLVRRFTDITKEDLRSVLIREQSRLNVATLMEALNSTLEFESVMSRMFGVAFEEIIAPPQQPQQQQQQQPHPTTTPSTPGTTTPSTPFQSQAKPFSVQTLSQIFDPYLGIFVEAQDRALAEMFVQYRQQGARVSGDAGSSDPHQGVAGGFGAEGIFGSSAASSDPTAASAASSSTVLPSSTELFYFYRQTLEQCARLSNREPLRDLCEVYKRWLRVYAEDVLRSALIKQDTSRRSLDIRPNVAEIQKWCLVLNTADYCSSTCGQLEDKLREKIHPDFRDGVSLEDEKEIFTTVISYTVQTLARELEMCSEPIWNSMLRPAVPWSQMQMDSQGMNGGAAKSQYISDLASLLEQIGVVVRQEVENKRYVRSWCDKVVAVLTTKFLHTLVRLRPISFMMAEQFLIDAAEMKKSLIELPRYPIDDGVGSSTGDDSLSHWMPAPTQQQKAITTAAASYIRYVNRLTERIELLLRVIQAPLEAIDAGGGGAGERNDLVTTYIKLVADRSFTNFQKVLDLKGVRKVDQNGLLDRFLKVTSSIDNNRNDDGGEDASGGGEAQRTSSSMESSAGVALADQSFLTSLDMDPSMQPVLQSPFNPSTPSFLDSSNGMGMRRNSQSIMAQQQRSNSLFGDHQGRNSAQMHAANSSNTESAAAANQSGAAGRALSDLRKFGNFFGAALGRREEGGRR